jgi:ZIP family zinc transporter
MLGAALLGLATVTPLFLGAILGVFKPLPARPLAVVLAFGAGTMIASVSIGLFEPATEELGGTWAALALLAGTTTFVLGSRAIGHRSGGARSAVGWALLLGVLLDGIPENAALGVNKEVDIALLAAIAIGNAPEAIGGAEKMMKEAGLSRAKVLGIWTAVSILLLLVVVLARAAGDSLSPSGIATVEAFAGGAVIAVLADSMIPEAYKDGGPNVAFAVAAGFALAFALGG